MGEAVEEIGEEALEMDNVEVNEREADKGNGQPSEWRMVQWVKKY